MPTLLKATTHYASLGAALIFITACHKSAEAPMTWDMKTTVGAYEKAGHANAKWDVHAKNALREFAKMRALRDNSNHEFQTTIADDAKAALQDGCFDPMVRYLAARFAPAPGLTWADATEIYCKIAADLQRSSYPAVRKFYVWRWAGADALEAYRRYDKFPSEIAQYNIFNNAEADLLAALPDATMPASEAAEISEEYLHFWRGDSNAYPAIYQRIMAALPPGRDKTPEILSMKGQAEITMAWLARGNGYSDSVTQEGWRLFGEHLTNAEAALTSAYRLKTNDAQIDERMMTVVLGLNEGHDQMEMWFERAMQTNPNDYEAADSMLNSLQPKWGGAPQDMIDFGRKCVENHDWGGHVPLILYYAHVSIAELYPESDRLAYWRRPEVWPDIKATFDRFFELNPDTTGWYHEYALCAYRAGQWQAFNELVPKLGNVNYKFFGGEDEFQRMVANARERAASPTSAQK